MPAVIDGNGNGSTLNELKQTLVDNVCGEPTTKAGWAHLNRVASMIRDRDGTPDDIRYRAEWIVTEWGPEKLTLASLEKHWPRFDATVGQLSEAEIERHKRDREREERRRRIVGEGSPP